MIDEIEYVVTGKYTYQVTEEKWERGTLIKRINTDSTLKEILE